MSEFVKCLLTKIDNYLSEMLGVYAIIPQMRHIQCPSAYVVKPRGGKVWLYYYCLRLTDAVAVISAELSAVVSAVSVPAVSPAVSAVSVPVWRVYYRE